MSEPDFILFKKVLEEGIQHKEPGQGIAIKISPDSIEFSTIPQPISGGGYSGKKRRPKKKFSLQQVQEALTEWQDLVKITDESDYIKVLPTKYLDEMWTPINDKIRDMVGGYCWIKDTSGKEKHWRIPKQ